MHAYRRVLERGSVSVHYATIIEVHHPEYLGVDELNELYDVAAANRAGGKLRTQPESVVWYHTFQLPPQVYPYYWAKVLSGLRN